MRAVLAAVVVVAAVTGLCGALPHNMKPHAPAEAKTGESLLSQLKQTTNATRAQEILTRVEELRAALKEQAASARQRSQVAVDELTNELTTLDTTLTQLQSQLSTASEAVDLVKERLGQVNAQLFGANQGGDSTSEEAVLNAMHLDLHSNTPDALPDSADGSVLNVLKLVWQQLERVEAACEADSAHHTTRGGQRADITAINSILDDITRAAKGADVLEGCAFCNHTFCRSIGEVCLMARPESGVPYEAQPDVASCWSLIDEYCAQLPGARDPGCGCAAADRCWNEEANFGRCPTQSMDGSRECADLQQLECKDFYSGDLAVLFGSPAYSAADELLVQRLRELRQRLVAQASANAPEAANADQPVHCATDVAALTEHFKKTEAVVSTLWRRREEVILDLQAAQVVAQAKRDMIEAATESRQQLHVRIAQETQASIARQHELTSTLRALDEVLGVVGDVGLARKAYERPYTTRETAGRSCQQLKRLDPTLPSGPYWVTLGKSKDEAVRVYCDMVTDGGGWMLVWKNVGGAVSSTARLQHASNGELLGSSDRHDLVTPPGADHKAQIAHRAFSYAANRQHQEWMKWMVLYRGREDEAMTQRVRVEMRSTRFSAVLSATDACTTMPSPMRVYSTDPASPHSATSYYMGETAIVLNQRNESFGLANSGTTRDMCLGDVAPVPPLASMCNAVGGDRASTPVTRSVLCDFEMLRRLSASGNVTVASTWEIVRHLFSYVHHSPSARESSRCMYKCWEDNDEDDAQFNEVFVWGVRGQCPAANGQECNGNGDCDDGVCTCHAGYVGDSCDSRVSCASRTVDGDVSEKCDGWKFGDECRYECPVGFHLLGSESADCLADGTWSRAVPSCAPVTCPVLSLPLDATVACSGNTHADTCRLSCLNGFKPIGATVAECSAVGEWQWEGDAPACERVHCNAIAAPTNGSVSCSTPDFEFATECRFFCNGRFALRGDASRVCGGDGLFTGTQPTCEPLVCSEPVVAPHVTVACSGVGAHGSYARGDQCTFACDPNYRLAGSSAATCQRSGEWETQYAEPPTCEVMDACMNTVCSSTVPQCDRGYFPLPPSSWAACCFDPDTDCAQFTEYVAMTVAVLGDYSESADGIRNINSLKRAVAFVSDVLPDDVTVVSNDLDHSDHVTRVLQLAVAPASLASKQSSVSVILSSLKASANTNAIATEMAAEGLTDTVTFVESPIIVPRVPTEIAHSAVFEDRDGRTRWVMGEVTVHRHIPVHRGVLGYALFFGDGKGVAPANRLGDEVARTVVGGPDSPQLVLTVPTSQIPSAATEWLVFSYGPFADAETAFSLPILDLERLGGNLTSGSATFRNEDARAGWVRGTLSLHLGEAPKDCTSFVLYFGDGGTGQGNKVGWPIGESRDASADATIELPVSVEVPEGATKLLVFARNVDVEGQLGLVAEFGAPL